MESESQGNDLVFLSGLVGYEPRGQGLGVIVAPNRAVRQVVTNDRSAAALSQDK
jgi:hypothetical protein